MNKRIRELADQVAGEFELMYTDVPKDFYDRFAELIILESKCWIHKRMGPKTALDFLEHFGVEE